ncbi:hypothetical protein TNCV_2687911 [Trichonephila clavipes]|nr:hypothetical protein TNCV_2687911 [Trichonephila clavipes]
MHTISSDPARCMCDSVGAGFKANMDASKRYDRQYCYVLCSIAQTEKEYQKSLTGHAVLRFSLHDNDRSHVDIACQTLLSLDLSPSEYRIFGRLKKALTRWQFSDNNVVEANNESWLNNQSFFTQSIHHAVDHWDTCSSLQGDFV